MLAASQSSLFEAESSRRGKAGALWETAFPLLHPLPSPRSTPSLGGRGEPCFRLLPAFGKSREDRFLPASPSRASHGPRALARRAGSCLRALTPYAFAVPHNSGGRASGNNQRKRELPARGLGASRQGGEAVRRASFGKLPVNAKLSDVFSGGQVALARSSKGARRGSARRPPSPSRSPARRDALGRRAAAGVPDSQSARERGERAEGPKSPANKAGVIWWSKAK